MPILTVKNEYVVFLTYDCNWNCPYCAIQNSFDRQRRMNSAPVEQRLGLIPNNSVVTFAGGEPGLVPRSLVEKYIDIAAGKNCVLYLETNGTFIDRYPDLVGKFREVLYHCSVDMKNPSHVEYGYPNIRYLLIATDDNVGNLERFLEFNPSVKFDIIACTYPHGATGPVLSRRNRNMILTKFGNRMTAESVRRMIHEKDFESITWLS